MNDDPKQDKIQAAIRFIADTLDISEDGLDRDSSMDNTTAWDSSEHMNICLQFEQKFGVPMNMDTITSATSIRALAALIP